MGDAIGTGVIQQNSVSDVCVTTIDMTNWELVPTIQQESDATHFQIATISIVWTHVFSIDCCRDNARFIEWDGESIWKFFDDHIYGTVSKGLDKAP